MLRLLGPFITCALLGGCSAPSPTTDLPSASQLPTPSETKPLPPDVHVADDGVVRNGRGDAYCVVMFLPVDKESEKDYPVREFRGVTYVMCCEACPGMFDKEPERYAIKTDARP